MVFWRKKKNITQQEDEERDERLLHPKGEPGIELPVDYDPEMSGDVQNELGETDTEILDDLDEIPLPESTPLEKSLEKEALGDHSDEGGWFSRLAGGLSKSSSRITRSLSDIVTRSRLDQEMLDGLEEMLIQADLGPKTASAVIEDFSKERFGKDISEREIREALAVSVAKILEPVARPLEMTRPENGPFVLLVCGVNGAGKTTTIGKYAHFLKKQEGKSVMIAAGDTFRAAAVEQLAEWARRAEVGIVARDVGADAASVAFEAYEQAVREGADVLMIDTAGRLQNKSNLMAELEKIIRVLRKKDENIPHAVLLVLDATTGQNAFSQVETFRKAVDITGLIVTKLDGSAKGGVMVGLADRFGLPVHAVGVGEGIRDLRPFRAEDYARSLMGIPSS